MYTKNTSTAVCAKIHAKNYEEHIEFWMLMTEKSKARIQTPCSLLAFSIKCEGWGTYPKAQTTSGHKKFQL